jgi:hypothetical protein
MLVPSGSQQTATAYSSAGAVREAIVSARDAALLLPPKQERPRARVGTTAFVSVPVRAGRVQWRRGSRQPRPAANEPARPRTHSSARTGSHDRLRPRGGVRIEACDGPEMVETHRRPAAVTRFCFVAFPGWTDPHEAVAQRCGPAVVDGCFCVGRSWWFGTRSARSSLAGAVQAPAVAIWWR